MYYHSILISVTEVCTVGCRHCGFTGAIRERQAETSEIADWVTQACDFGIRNIIFTGGEPFQRFRLLKAGVQAAASHGNSPHIGVFTSSFWGKDREAVDTILGQLKGLTNLYLSTDVFHQEQVPAQYVMNVIEGGLSHGVDKIELCITVANDEEEEQICSLYDKYRDQLYVHTLRVIPTPHIDTDQPPGDLPTPDRFETSCFLHTPLVNPNGDLCSCHIAKVGAHAPLRDEVYFLGNLKERTFKEIMSDAEEDYGYQFLRAFGPQGVARMVQSSENLKARFGHKEFSGGCDLCSKVMMNRHGKAALKEYVSDPFQRELIDTVRSTRLGEAR